MKSSILPVARILARDVMANNRTTPYNPTRILKSDSDRAYVLAPADDSATGAVQLRTIDLKQPISKTTTPSILSSQLPFLNSTLDIAFTPVIDAFGNLTVIAGNCADGAAGIQVWRYTPAWDKTGVKDGKWTQFVTSEVDSTMQNSRIGSNYLGQAISFSHLAKSSDADTRIYNFGGMCPDDSAPGDDWTNNATYSNTMITLSLDATTNKALNYDVSLAASRGPPIAEAGFSITPLSPSYSANSSDTPQTMQQTFVLLGGHTKTAFINMSQIATYSLPEEAWTFLPVTQPAGTTNGTVISQVEPRSGHTALLSDDGTKIFLYGGWVGDAGTPAQPQYAVLNIGTDANGQGKWTWSIPSEYRLSATTGVYGHGALMLPGDVMMIYGGYNIRPATSSSIPSDDIQLFNTTSNTWIESYSPPKATSGQSSTSISSTSSKRIGLGVGLGIAAAFIFLALGFCFWYSRRSRKRRTEGRTMLMSQGSDSTYREYDDMPQLPSTITDDAGFSAFWNNWYGNAAQQARAQNLPPMTEQGGMAGTSGAFIDLPSPTRGMRKKLGGRSYAYHATNNDDARMIHSSGIIHPIAEQENEDGSETGAQYEQEQVLLDAAEEKLREVEAVLSDPFADPPLAPLHSHPPYQSAQRPAMMETALHSDRLGARSIPRKPLPMTSIETSRLWREQNDLGAGFTWDHNGRISPTKTEERTSSTLSDRSMLSNSSIARTMSAKTGTILAAAAARIVHYGGSSGFSENRSSITHSSSSNRSPAYSSYRGRLPHGEVATIHNASSESGSSRRTTRSNFLMLQTEGQELLGGRPNADPDDPYQRAMAAADPASRAGISSRYDSLGMPVSNRPSRPSILGSLRRALNAVAMGGAVSDRMTSPITPTGDHYTDEKRASSTSPNKGRLIDADRRLVPRRAASDGGAFIRQKRGAKDWEEGKQWPPYRDDPDAGDWGEPRTSSDQKQAEEEWDVEGAAADRDIQVMFSVPKTRLRVVNADADRASLRSVSDGALSRAGSTRRPMSMHHKPSARSLARSERDRNLLDERDENVLQEDGVAASPNTKKRS